MQRIARISAKRSAPSWTKPTLRGALAVAIGLNGFAAHAAEPAWAVPGGPLTRACFEELLGRLVRALERESAGPPLTRIGDRTYIAGMLRNTPANLVRWIREPQAVIPGNAMPNMGVSEADARDIAAYLYTLR